MRRKKFPIRADSKSGESIGGLFFLPIVKDSFRERKTQSLLTAFYRKYFVMATILFNGDFSRQPLAVPYQYDRYALRFGIFLKDEIHMIERSHLVPADDDQMIPFRDSDTFGGTIAAN